MVSNDNKKTNAFKKFWNSLDMETKIFIPIIAVIIIGIIAYNVIEGGKIWPKK
jgi:hypothetical protein